MPPWLIQSLIAAAATVLSALIAYRAAVRKAKPDLGPVTPSLVSSLWKLWPLAVLCLAVFVGGWAFHSFRTFDAEKEEWVANKMREEVEAAGDLSLIRLLGSASIEEVSDPMDVRPWSAAGDDVTLSRKVPDRSLGEAGRPGADGALRVQVSLDNWQGLPADVPPYRGAEFGSPPSSAQMIVAWVGLPQGDSSVDLDLYAVLEAKVRDRDPTKTLRVMSKQVLLTPGEWSPLILNIPASLEMSGDCTAGDLELVTASVLFWGSGKTYSSSLYIDDLKFYSLAAGQNNGAVEFLCDQRSGSRPTVSSESPADDLGRAARYRVGLVVSPPGDEPEWTYPGEVVEGAVFSMIDEGGEIGLGLRPVVVDYGGPDGSHKVSIEVLRILNPRTRQEVVRSRGSVVAESGRPVTFSSPDGEGDLQVKLTTVKEIPSEGSR